VHSAYLDAVAEEVNDCLQASGHVVLADLYKRFSLPLDVLAALVDARLGPGRTIDGRRDTADAAVLYTEAFVARQRALVRGAVLAVTRPTPVASLATAHLLDRNLFLGPPTPHMRTRIRMRVLTQPWTRAPVELLEDLITTGTVRGRVRGPRDRALYVPTVYQRTQAAGATAFFRQNGYIGTSCLRPNTGTHRAAP
jgi:E3 UFM1-protein ligase 1